MAAEPIESFDELIKQGLACRERREFAGAIERFRAACRLRPDSIGARCELAFTCLQSGDLEEAGTAYLAVLDANPGHGGALAGLGLLAKKRGDPAAAVPFFRKALAQRSEDRGLRLELAGALRELAQLDEAQAQYQRVLADDPGNWMALVGLGLIARQRGEHEGALEYFSAAQQRQPEHAGLQGELAFTLRQLDRLDEAQALYRRMLDADPKSVAALLGLGQIALTRGQFYPAIALVQQACELDPQNVGTRIFLAAIHRDSGQLADAFDIVEKVLAAAPEHAGAWIERGLVERARNDRTAALAAFEHATALHHGRGPIEAAAEHLALGHPDRAREAYQEVLATSPGDFDALLGLAGLQMIAADYENCIQTCDALIAQYPKRIAAYRPKCLALIQLDRAEEAERLAMGLETSGPLSIQADALRLEILRTCGRRAQALALLREPRFEASRSFALRLEVVLTRLALFDLSGAQAALENPPAQRPYERSRVHYVEGMLADQQWRVRDAVAAFERALDLHASDAGAHLHLARLYLLLPDAGGSSKHLELSLGQSTSTLLLRGESRNISQNLTGQLLNEFKLDRPLLERLAGLQHEDFMQRVQALRALVQSNPGLTPPALFLLLALRQSGAFEVPAEPDRPLEPLIPRKIVQYWDQTQPPEGIVRLLRTWVEAHPGYPYCRFDRSSARAYLVAHYPPEVAAAFWRASHPAQASDIFRLAYLLREGGFYVDADDRCIGHLSLLGTGNAQFIAYQEQYASLGNNFLGCVAGEPVIGRALDLAVEAVSRGDADSIWLATGPGLLTRVFAQVLAEQGEAWPQWLGQRRILDRSELAQVSWPHAILPYKNTSRGWLRRPA